MKRFSVILLITLVLFPWLEGCRGGPTSANSNNGWSETTGNAPWAARYGLSGTVYSGNMWVIGGASGSGSVTNYYGDVWESSDGKNWTETNSNPPFGARYNPQVVTFANAGVTQLYLIGGNAGGTLKNDVWTSTDGTTWNQILANNSAITKNTVGGTQFCPRQDFNAVVFNNLIYVIGGADVTSGSDGLNDVWSSPDGITWTQLLANKSTPGAGQFPGRWGAAAVSFNNNLYVASGHETNSNLINNDLWSTTTGSTWTYVSTFDQVYYHQLVENNNEFWYIGGYAPWAGGSTNYVETSGSGTSWSGQGAEPFGERFGHLCLVFNGSIWIIGGVDNNSQLTYYNDVWHD